MRRFKAGAQGKGFAVVAEEIRKLVERSGVAAKEIAALIEERCQRVQVGSKAVATVSTSLASIEADIRSQADISRRAGPRGPAGAGQGERRGGRCHGHHTPLHRAQRLGHHGIRVFLAETTHTVDDLAELAVQLRQLIARFRWPDPGLSGVPKRMPGWCVNETRNPSRFIPHIHEEPYFYSFQPASSGSLRRLPVLVDPCLLCGVRCPGCSAQAL